MVVISQSNVPYLSNYRVQQRKAGVYAHVAAARFQRLKRVCSAYDFLEEDDELEHPYIFFTATEVQDGASDGSQSEQ